MCHTPTGYRRDAHLPFWGHEPVGGNTIIVWRMASATPDLRLPSQPQGITAHWLVPNYTAWWQRHMCVNKLPRVALDSGEARIRTRDLLIVLTTRPPSHVHKACAFYKIRMGFVRETWVRYGSHVSVDQFYELLSSKRVLGNSWTTSTVVKRPSSLPYDHDFTMTDSAYTRPGLENLIFIT